MGGWYAELSVHPNGGGKCGNHPTSSNWTVPTLWNSGQLLMTPWEGPSDWGSLKPASEAQTSLAGSYVVDPHHTLHGAPWEEEDASWNSSPVFWPEVYKDFLNFCASWPECQLTARRPTERAPLVPLSWVSTLFELRRHSQTLRHSQPLAKEHHRIPVYFNSGLCNPEPWGYTTPLIDVLLSHYMFEYFGCMCFSFFPTSSLE